MKWQAALSILLVGALVGAEALGSDAIRLRDVSALTFHDGKMTASRRVSPVPQLQCVGGPCKREYMPRTVQCTNVGFDGESVQWRCEADLSNAVRFDEVTVGCEGYRDRYDEYVLKGSCGLEYSLEYTGNDNPNGYYRSSYSTYDSRSTSSTLGNILVMLIIGVIVYGIYQSCTTNSAAYAAAPPPYVPTSQYGYPSAVPGSVGGGFFGRPWGWSSWSPFGWSARPGWWSGMATGGLLGYLFSRRNYGPTYATGHYGPSYGGGYHSSNSTWSGSSSSSSRPSGSSGSRTTSGYGGTRNR